jgi:hypothetical protein
MSKEKILVNYFLSKNTFYLIASKILISAINEAAYPDRLTDEVKAAQKNILRKLLDNYLKQSLLSEWDSYSKTLSTKFKENFFEKTLFPAIRHIINANNSVDFKKSWLSSTWKHKDSSLTAIQSILMIILREYKPAGGKLNISSLASNITENVLSYHPESKHAALLNNAYKLAYLNPGYIIWVIFLIGISAYSFSNEFLWGNQARSSSDEQHKKVLNPNTVTRDSYHSLLHFAAFQLPFYNAIATAIILPNYLMYRYYNFTMLDIAIFLIKMLFNRRERSRIIVDASNSYLEDKQSKQDTDPNTDTVNEIFAPKQFILDELQVLVEKFRNIIIQEKKIASSKKNKGKEKEVAEKSSAPEPSVPSVSSDKAKEKEHSKNRESASGLSLNNPTTSSAAEKLAKSQRHEEAERRRAELSQIEENSAPSTSMAPTPPVSNQEAEFHIEIQGAKRRVYPFGFVYVAELEEATDAPVQTTYQIGRTLRPGQTGKGGFKAHSYKVKDTPGSFDGILKVQNGDRRIPCSLSRSDVRDDSGKLEKNCLVYIPLVELPKYKSQLRGFIPR